MTAHGRMAAATAAALGALVLCDAASARVPHAGQWGQRLFERTWIANDVASLPEGDGLGPWYDDVSCAACHQLGGSGGAGDAEHNAVLRADHRGAPYLHSPRFHAPVVGPRIELEPDDPFGGAVLVERNAPALFGAGLLDQVPESVLLAQEADEARAAEAGPYGHVPRGRVPRTATGDVGRFGWKGQHSTLEHAVQGACVYLGLTTPGHPEPRVAEHQDGDVSSYVRALVIHSGGSWPESPEAGIDLSDRDVMALTKHVAKLPRPTTPRHDAIADDGETSFVAIGCADCHPPSLGQIDGLFSDLLLHEMGPHLADPARSADLDGSIVRRPGEAGAYEWRTPPLWGLSASAPYLHDGRAATIEDAIRMHGGEATAARDAYGLLPAADRVRVLHFLGGLAPP